MIKTSGKTLLNPSEVIKNIMRDEKITGSRLATGMGIEAATLRAKLRGDNKLSATDLVDAASAMGYKIILVKESYIL